MADETMESAQVPLATRVEYKGFVIESDDPAEVAEWLKQFFMTKE